MAIVTSHIRKSKKGNVHGVVMHNRTMTKSALIKKVHEDFDTLPRRDVSEIIDAEHRVISDELKKGHNTRIPGFGTFRVVRKKAKAARMGMNPFTKKMQKFKAKPAKNVVRFKLSSKIKI